MTTTATATALGNARPQRATENLQDKRTRCEVWTRVMGYHRPTSHFNIGKKSEHYSRQHFSEKATANSEFCAKN